MRYRPYSLFGGGIMLAISGAAKLPAPLAEGAQASFLNQFPDTWPVFVGGFVATIVGLVMWWSDVFAARARSRAEDNAGSNPLALLQNLLPQLRRLADELDSLDCESLAARVEHVLEHSVTPIAEARQKLFDRYGMRAGAEILITAAFGERMLNRVWSAAADGHLPEARSSFLEAVEAFAQAEETVARLAAAPA